jgi:antitoxin HicB
LEVALEDGDKITEPVSDEKFSGKFVLRLPKSLHRKLARNARKENVSLNQYAVSLLSERNIQRHP